MTSLQNVFTAKCRTEMFLELFETSEECIMLPGSETTKALRDKHPSGDILVAGNLASETDLPPSIKVNEVRAAIQGFLNGSAGGSDGMRPGFFKELHDFLRGSTPHSVAN